MKSLIVKIALFSSLLASYNVTAAVYLYCEGTIENVSVGNWHGVYIKPSWHEEGIRICDVDGGWSTAPKAVCDVWLPGLQTAVHLNSTVKFRWADAGVTDCSELPAFSTGKSPDSIYFLK
jgi:hypothetical protein